METKYGTLVRWLADRNFGFIREDQTGQDIFTHVSGFTAKVASPKGSRVRFHLAPNPRRAGDPMAVDVEPLVASAVIS
jgi:cold shock CspA family protein